MHLIRDEYLKDARRFIRYEDFEGYNELYQSEKKYRMEFGLEEAQMKQAKVFVKRGGNISAITKMHILTQEQLNELKN